MSTWGWQEWGWHDRTEVGGREKKDKDPGFHPIMVSALPPFIGTMPQIREPRAVSPGEKPQTPSSIILPFHTQGN